MFPIRATTYFRQARDDVLAQVPESARTILDLGCGAGVLGEHLRARQPCEVWGIECDPTAACEAGARLDRVIESTIEAAIPQLPAGHFDTLIAADRFTNQRSADAYRRYYDAAIAAFGRSAQMA